MANSVGIIILAGGRSSRMGEDKGLIKVNEKPVIQYLIDTCKVICSNILIVSNSATYSQFGYPVINDIIPNIGPIGGVYSGLLNSNYDFNIVLSCDVPMVSVKLLQHLIDSKPASRLTVITQYQNQIHPLIGLYNKNCINVIKDLINCKKYRMSDLYEHKETTILDLSHFPEKEFLNLNTQADLAIFKQHINDD